MLKHVLNLLTGGPYYLRVNRERVSLRDISSNRAFECRAILGIDSSNRVASVGDPVSGNSVTSVNPFDHPRVLVHDFNVAEKIFAYAVERVAEKRFLRPMPDIVVHPDLRLDGGLTMIEDRVLRELAENAGARKVAVHYGDILTDAGVRDALKEAK